MRHNVFGKQLGRSVGQRNALRRTMITQLFDHERITTTHAKAQSIRAAAEHMITQAKRGLAEGDPARVVYLRRLLNGRLNDTEITKKVFEVLAPRYAERPGGYTRAERPGGYTRIYKLGPRKGDNAPMVILELVDSNVKPTDTAATTGTASRPLSGARGLLNRVRRPRVAASETPAEQNS